MSVCVARKGDLVLVERTRNDFVIGEPTRRSVTFEFGVVASATREGVVKSWRAVGWGGELVSSAATPVIFADRCMVVSAKRVNVGATIAAAKAHHWPGHPGQPMPFGSVEAARAVVVR